MIVVTDRTAPCPVCHGFGGFRKTERYPEGTTCTACLGTGTIRQAGHQEETP